jgi:hypothetical protein
MSHYTKARYGGYYNDLLEGDDHDFFKLLRKYSIDPIGAVEGYKGKALGTIITGANADALRPKLGDMTQGNILKMGVSSAKKVAYIDLQLNGRQQIKPGTAGPTAEKVIGDKITFNATYTPTPGYVPVYFLPWENQHSIRITIPPMGHRTTKGLDDPDLFFTAGINGCSVLIEGTTQNPTIYHCGGGTGLAEKEAAEFWEEVVNVFIGEEELSAVGQKDRGRNVVASVDKRDYIKQAGVQSTSVSSTGVESRLGTTARAKSYLGNLRAKHKLGKLLIEDVAPWGCVLGRRNATTGDWAFYLQENATVSYHSVERPLSGGFRAVKSSSWSVARPLSYREIFPNGTRHATVRAGLPKII